MACARVLGYNYGSTDPLVLIPMVVTTILMGVLIGWLRMRTDSIYPGALAHGALNASTSVLPLGIVVGGAVDLSGTVLGWGGWLVVLVVIAVLVASRSFRWARAPRALGPAVTR
ncbi:CPBP family intramembrane glutamic endopeptidase [Sanguibacter sp. 25GB23B1]|uniref:CPBP family intramembrane glutamic endopeptidase n=1 Tax=unclassified Sanguibacter TaxID=2645534 RepID=UPI0032B01A8C